MPQLTLNRRYSRKEISQILGGSRRAFLPTKDGKVVCGCFTKDETLNPGAPEEVLIGRDHDVPIVEKNAELVASQRALIPIFLFRAGGEWEYIGDYRCTKLERNPTILKQKMVAHPRRPRITGILYFEKEGTL